MPIILWPILNSLHGIQALLLARNVTLSSCHGSHSAVRCLMQGIAALIADSESCDTMRLLANVGLPFHVGSGPTQVC